jgi:hypothetical protein
MNSLSDGKMKNYLLALLLVISIASAAQVINHQVKVTVREDGTARVEEEYLARLQSDDDRTEFSRFANQKSTIADWAALSLSASIARPRLDEAVVAEQTQSDFAIVTFAYSVPQAVESIEKTGRQELTGVTEKLFTFWNGERIILPYDPPTTLQILVPKTLQVAEVTPPVYSTTVETGQDGRDYVKYEWNYRRPFNTDRLRVAYSKEVTLQSLLSPETIISDVQKRYGTPAYLLAAAIVIGILAWYRKEIQKLVHEAFSAEPVLEEE